MATECASGRENDARRTVGEEESEQSTKPYM